MKILILSCSTGGGHNAAGRALRDRAILEGHEAKLLDIMSLAGDRTSKVVGGTYINVAKYTPKLFQAIYQAGELVRSPRRKSPVYYANAAMAGHLKKYLETCQPDVLAMPHLFPAETVTYMKRKGMLSIPAVAVSTDYTCIPFWEETDCDAYIVPHPELLREYTDRGIPRERLYPLGIPCSMEFQPRFPKEEARTRLGLQKNRPLFLVIGGSMGFGKIRMLTEELFAACKEGEQIAVICGNDRRMCMRLREEYGGEERIRILGYTDQVSLWMDACDVVYTKPGGLTSTEALVKQVPIIHTAPIPGCETKNAEFFSSRGMSVTEENVERQVEMGRLLLGNREMRERMQLAQKQNAFPGASLEILRLMERLIARG